LKISTILPDRAWTRFVHEASVCNDTLIIYNCW
jgi:hypothetical protein